MAHSISHSHTHPHSYPWVDVSGLADVLDGGAAFGVSVFRAYVDAAGAFVAVALVKGLAVIGISRALSATPYLPYAYPDLVTPVSLALTLCAVLVYSWSSVMLILLVKERNDRTNFFETAVRALRLLPSFWFLLIIIGVVVAVGTTLLVIPGLVIAVWLIPAFFVLVYEGERGWQAFETSFRYARDHFWTLLSLLVFSLVFTYAVSTGIQGLVRDIAVGANQNWFEAGTLLQWVIAPTVSFLIWAAVIPLGVTVLSLGYEVLTGRVSPVRVNVGEAVGAVIVPVYEAVSRYRPRWRGHRADHPY
ncbi:MAG: hypothetical protein WD049_08060 [Candidatus Paceibacterota bacterium]